MRKIIVIFKEPQYHEKFRKIVQKNLQFQLYGLFIDDFDSWDTRKRLTLCVRHDLMEDSEVEQIAARTDDDYIAFIRDILPNEEFSVEFVEET